ncbi:single-stranded DNA-binding protein [Corynebacterium sp. H78]|uniref:single-stranded DNA-binding protein n=1 Tax=Corynebacterium sp. H78 TaxID=3133417 RepID=UPI0030B63129
MAQGETPITLVGNVVAEPELKYTQSGAAVANFRIASTPRFYNRDTNQWTDGDGLFLTCNVWRDAAENVVETLSKGMRVIVYGRLRQRNYETREGERRTVYEVEVDEVGPSLRFASAQVNRNPRNSGGGQGQGGFGGGARQGGANQGGRGFGGGNQGGFNQGGGQGGNQGFGGGAPTEDPWNSAPMSGGGFAGGDSEPPF